MKKLMTMLALATSMLASTAAATADPGPNTCHRLRNAVATGTPVSALPPQLLRRCFGHQRGARPTVAVRPVATEDGRPAAATDLRPVAGGAGTGAR
jgi:hypothetical protein